MKRCKYKAIYNQAQREGVKDETETKVAERTNINSAKNNEGGDECGKLSSLIAR